MAEKIKIAQINHVTTMVKDTDRAMKFYNDLLGIKQIQSQVDNHAITWLQLDNGVMVHLIETDEAPAKPGNIHHAFQVDNLEETTTEFEKQGAVLTNQRIDMIHSEGSHARYQYEIKYWGPDDQISDVTESGWIGT